MSEYEQRTQSVAWGHLRSAPLSRFSFLSCRRFFEAPGTLATSFSDACAILSLPLCGVQTYPLLNDLVSCPSPPRVARRTKCFSQAIRQTYVIPHPGKRLSL